MTRNLISCAAVVSLLSLGACTDSWNSFNTEAGAEVDEGAFGGPTMNNSLVMMGEIDATQALAGRFASEVPSTITFAFNSSDITPESAAILSRQANWIAQFPEVRFRVYGHTDLVGSDAYNKSLGLRRAKAVVSYFASKGISRSRLEAVASFGETQPVINTAGPEQANRRTVTEVTGFVKGAPSLINGKYIEVVWREYVEGATRIHPQNTTVKTEVDPAGAGG